jgi:sucrase/ferredoxin-like protein
VSASTPDGQPAEPCSRLSSRSDEPLAGTASVVRSWLLLERPGPWPPTALASSRLPGGLGAELTRRANQHRVRVVLIRRPGRPVRADREPACFVASTRPAGSWLARLRLDAPEHLLDLDWADLLVAGTRRRSGPGTGSSPSWMEPVEEPLFCVCTHGRHDPCCAELGRPVAAAIAARYPHQLWEVSHIGGDRFAGNLLCLPDGDYFGRLDAQAAGVATRYCEGAYALAHLRGRCCYLPPVQAADVLVRRRLGVEQRGDVRVSGAQRLGELTTVQLAVAGHGRLTASVRLARLAPRRLTCHAEQAASPPAYELVGLTPGPADS